jgi:uncharacterized protein (DUF2147 family)
MRLLSATMLLAGLASPAAAIDPGGDWMVTEKTAVIHIAPCTPTPGAPPSAGPASFCGVIYWTKGPPGTDQNNPDPAKRSRSVIGMPTILDMKPSATPNKWEGQIYNAEDGKTYSGNISLVSDNVLRVQGCVLGFLCGGQDWTRAVCDTAKSTGSPPMTRTTASPSPRLPVATACRELAPAQPPATR